MAKQRDDWFEDEEIEGGEQASLTEYDVTAAPNDFNVTTLFNFIESGVIEIPPFQRHFVWDIKRSSRLIESLIMGLPIPQMFLYEKARNKFLVIDGQQRLLSIYYFLKLRFPIPANRPALRKELASAAAVPPGLLADNKFFTGFKLSLPLEDPSQKHPLEDLDYSELDEHKTALDLRTIRVVVVKQSAPKGDDAIYEIFNRLNSGGVNLTAQEIRMSLYHSPFMRMLAKVNFDPRWRKLLGLKEADLHFRDLEFILRGLALLSKGKEYKPSMARFLNAYSFEAEKYTQEMVDYYEALVDSFFNSCARLDISAFQGQTSKFTVSIFDAVFAAVCEKPFRSKKLASKPIDPGKLEKLKSNKAFSEAAQARTTGVGNVKDRIRIAKDILIGD